MSCACRNRTNDRHCCLRCRSFPRGPRADQQYQSIEDSRRGAHHFIRLMPYQRGICQIHNVKRQRFIHSPSDHFGICSERQKKHCLEPFRLERYTASRLGSFVFEEAPDLSENFTFPLPHCPISLRASRAPSDGDMTRQDSNNP